MTSRKCSWCSTSTRTARSSRRCRVAEGSARPLRLRLPRALERVRDVGRVRDFDLAERREASGARESQATAPRDALGDGLEDRQFASAQPRAGGAKPGRGYGSPAGKVNRFGGPAARRRELDPGDPAQHVGLGDHAEQLVARHHGQAADLAVRHQQSGLANRRVRADHDRRRATSRARSRPRGGTCGARRRGARTGPRARRAAGRARTPRPPAFRPGPPACAAPGPAS